MTFLFSAKHSYMPSPLHFLVVDDQPITRLIIIELLNRLGYTCISEAAHGQHALNLLRSEKLLGLKVNFVISDCNMPIMDGLTLLRTIRASTDLQHLPVLLVTMNVQANTVEAAMQAGADGYLDKQFLNIHIFKEVLDEILMKRGLPSSEPKTKQ